MPAKLDYELVVSRRAKRVTLRVVPGRGLVVSIPQRFPKACVPEFVQRNRTWIDAALKEQVDKTPLPYRQWPPRELWLPAPGKSLLLNYISETDVVLLLLLRLTSAHRMRRAQSADQSSQTQSSQT